jgi:hypothetical protein
MPNQVDGVLLHTISGKFLRSIPKDCNREAALTQTLVYGAKVEDAARTHGQSVTALTKHRQRILQEIRLELHEEVTEPEPKRLRFQYGQFSRSIGLPTKRRRTMKYICLGCFDKGRREGMIGRPGSRHL